MQQPELIPHLFRTEYRKIIAVLCKRFGFSAIETAEDITSDTFMLAAQIWGLKGIPPNPIGWLYTVAKNKAKNFLHRQATFTSKVAPVTAAAERPSASPEFEIDLSPQNINDSQLQMMFAICNPAIAEEAQIGLSLRILCGFGIEEIADAFLTNKETINKRLFRAKEKLRAANIPIELPGITEIDERLNRVLATIYLLFNEGYYSISNNKTLRKDLCMEAMRLCNMLVENKHTNKPPVNALLSLMCFHASRFEARINEQGELILYDEQDTSLWDADLISRGSYFLHCSATGNQLTKYHLEAAIAYWSTQRDDTQEKWENVLQLYNRLLKIEYSPIAALNRTFALSKANGKKEAIIEAEKLNLTSNHFYYTLLGELYSGIDNAKAMQHFEKALSLAKTDTDKAVIRKKKGNRQWAMGRRQKAEGRRQKAENGVMQDRKVFSKFANPFTFHLSRFTFHVSRLPIADCRFTIADCRLRGCLFSAPGTIYLFSIFCCNNFPLASHTSSTYMPGRQ